MANDTIPMKIMFQACYDILDNILTPLHYRDLAEMAIQSLGVDIKDVNYNRQIEDVREKMASLGRMDTFYTGAPLCLVGLKHWFENRQLHLFNGDTSKPIIIGANVNSGVSGAFEGLMRFPHMMQHGNAPIEVRAMACARGLILEKHVADWFSANWPAMIISPDNHGRWNIPCSHDFKIRVGGRIMPVDVWGPNATGGYSKPPAKKSTFFHLQCRPSQIGDHVAWESVIPGRLYDLGQIFPEGGISPRRLAVFLNCVKNNLDYDDIRKYA
jgi:hypothetical protein